MGYGLPGNVGKSGYPHSNIADNAEGAEHKGIPKDAPQGYFLQSLSFGYKQQKPHRDHRKMLEYKGLEHYPYQRPPRGACRRKEHKKHRLKYFKGYKAHTVGEVGQLKIQSGCLVLPALTPENTAPKPCKEHSKRHKVPF